MWWVGTQGCAALALGFVLSPFQGWGLATVDLASVTFDIRPGTCDWSRSDRLDAFVGGELGVGREDELVVGEEAGGDQEVVVPFVGAEADLAELGAAGVDDPCLGGGAGVVEEGGLGGEEGEAAEGGGRDGGFRGGRSGGLQFPGGNGEEPGPDEHFGPEARVGIMDAYLGLECVALEVGLADDAGDGGMELEIGEKVGGEDDRLTDAEAGGFAERDIDAGLEFVGLVEFGDDGAVRVVHAEHALLAGSGVEAEDDSVDRSEDFGAVEGEFPAVQVGLGFEQLGVDGVAFGGDLGEFGIEAEDLGLGLFDGGFLGDGLELGLDEFSP